MNHRQHIARIVTALGVLVRRYGPQHYRRYSKGVVAAAEKGQRVREEQ